jgi:hypothetical protein
MWPHTDVAKECAVLAKMGYLGVKLFPAQEQLMSFETFSGDLNPWYFAYQPVSYRLQGRMGTRDQLRYDSFSFVLPDGSHIFSPWVGLPSNLVVSLVSESMPMLSSTT